MDEDFYEYTISYNGTAITYDGIGNPLSYYNGYTFTWKNGRQLATAVKSGQSVSYTYNPEGIRASKTVNGVTTSYFLEGDRVVKETNGSDTLWFYHDVSGSVISFELNGTAYFYVKNLQGDITGILNSNGTLVVEYSYDSWEKFMDITGSAASSVGVKNPYRYRGYRYDTETEFYYLQSRYYDPEVKRFINADKLLTAENGIVGYNEFAYCGGNPTNKADYNGYLGESLVWEYLLEVTIVACSIIIASLAEPSFENPVYFPINSEVSLPEIARRYSEKM